VLGREFVHHSSITGKPMPDAIPSRRRKDNSFDALRLIGALMVLIGHGFIITGHAAPLLFGRGIHQLGIWLFFAVSGYLITQSWIADPRPAAYARKRALRILPGLWLLLVGSVLVLGPLATLLPLTTYFADPSTYAYAVKNAVLLTSWSLPGVFAQAPVAGQMNGSLWSLPIESALYCIAPLAVWLDARHRAAAFAALLLVPPVVVAIWLERPGVLAIGFHGLNIGWGIAAAPLFLSGCLLRLAGFPNGPGKVTRLAGAGAVLALAAGALLLTSNTVLSVLLALPFAAVVIAIGCSPALHSRWLQRIGDLSYGIYLWAFPVQQLVFQTMGGGVWTNITVSLPIVAGLAALSWHLVEKRALQLKRWQPVPARVPLPA
jgi:peptidoglycan/LPS O-acetylase OafA/YrhL